MGEDKKEEESRVNNKLLRQVSSFKEEKVQEVSKEEIFSDNDDVVESVVFDFCDFDEVDFVSCLKIEENI